MKFKKFVIGLAIFILTILFIVFVNRTINPRPEYKYCGGYEISPFGQSYDSCSTSYNNALEDFKEKSFFIITVLSMLAIISGVLVKSVAPVSWGLVMAGLALILYIFIANFEEIDKPYRAIISGLALAILIWLAYAKLGDKEAIQETGPSSIPPVSPSAPLPSNKS